MTHLYAIVCRDVDDSKTARMDKLDEHRAHAQSVADRIKVAGPLQDESEENFTGSLLVITAKDTQDARAFIEADPYFAAGIWRDIQIDKLSKTAGVWVR